MKQALIEKIITNPVIPKVLILMYILLVLADIIIPFVDKEVKYEIRVRPANQDESTQKIFSDYSKASIYTKGSLVIKEPTIIDRLIFRTSETSSLTTLLAYFSILWILFRNSQVLTLVRNEFSFKSSLWKPIIQIGLILFALFYFNIAKDFIAGRNVKKYTNGEFKIDETFVHWVQLWAGFLLIFFSSAFKKASTLQQEQDLTV